MLRAIPDSASILAIDGVIPARAHGVAATANAIVKSARRRAAEQWADVQERTLECRRQASEDGFSAGFASGLQAAVAPIMNLLAAEDQLRDAALAAAREVLEKQLAELDVETGMIASWCSFASARASGKPLLKLPATRQALRDSLSSRTELEGIDIQYGSNSLPVLEIGHLVYQFDPMRPLMKRAMELLKSAEVEAMLEDAATRYTEAVTTGRSAGER